MFENNLSRSYCALFKNRAIYPRGQTDFLRVAFLEFAENHWGRGYVDPKLLMQARGKVTEPVRDAIRIRF